jgi:choline dehydrogenase
VEGVLCDGDAMNPDTWDYIVVGAGAAGCVIASRLSENPAKHVLLIEAGRPDRYPPIHIPGIGFMANANRDCNWWYETEPMAELNGRTHIWVQGRVFGGSSSINGMVCTRGHANDYDRWRDLGCESWGFDDVLPYFRKLERSERGESRFHGISGPMPVRRTPPSLPIYAAFLKASEQCGIPSVDDLNENVVEGFGYHDVNIAKGRRVSAAAAYLKPARQRSNLTVYSDTQVRRILFEGRRAAGVEIARGGRVEQVWADAEVILCAGAVRSPQLLMLSGIGSADALRALGIEVKVDSPHVGRNLQNHPSYRMQYACRGNTTSYTHLTAGGMLKAGLSYLFARRGALAESPFGVGGFFRSNETLNSPDLQLCICGGLIPRPTTSRIRDLLPQEQGFTLIVYQGTPLSRGEVRLRSADPDAAPVIESGIFADLRDLELLTIGLKRIRAICRSEALSSFITREIAPGDDIVTDADIERDIRQNMGTSCHPCGTCAMGPGDAVVDSRLRVRGVEGLRVADASIMPLIPTAGLHAPVLMIGEKAAAMIAADG